jgi:hypothetical protein
MEDGMRKRLDDAWIELWIKFEYFLDGFLYSYEAFWEWWFLMGLSTDYPHSVDYERMAFFNWYLATWDEGQWGN